MPPVAVHLLLGGVAAALLARLLRERPDRRAAGLGLVAGAVVPDADLLVAVPAALATGDLGVAAAIHGSVTHSLLTAAVVALAGTGLLIGGRRAWGVGAVAFAGGMVVLHALPDAFWLTGVQLLWPLTSDAWHLGPVAIDRYPEATVNAILGAELVLESLGWAGASWIAAQYDRDTRFTRALPVLAFVNLVLFIGLTTRLAPEVGTAAFVRVAYVPGILTILVSTILVPVLLRDTWQALGDTSPLDAHGT